MWRRWIHLPASPHSTLGAFAPNLSSQEIAPTDNGAANTDRIKQLRPKFRVTGKAEWGDAGEMRIKLITTPRA